MRRATKKIVDITVSMEELNMVSDADKAELFAVAVEVKEIMLQISNGMTKVNYKTVAYNRTVGFIGQYNKSVQGGKKLNFDGIPSEFIKTQR